MKTQTDAINPLKSELKSITHLLALLGAHFILHVSGLRVKNPPPTILNLCLAHSSRPNEKQTQIAILLNTVQACVPTVKRLCKYNVNHIPCNRLIIQYLIQQTEELVINNQWSRTAYTFRPLPGHHQGGIYEGIHVQRNLSKMRRA
jgi:hypothetical protein